MQSPKGRRKASLVVSEGGGSTPVVAPTTTSSSPEGRQRLTSPMLRALLTIEREKQEEAATRMGLHAQLNSMTIQFQQVQLALDEAAMDSRTLQREKIDVQGDRDRKEEALRVLRAKHDALQADYDALQAKYDDMEKKFKQSIDELSKCKDEMKRQSSEIEICNARRVHLLDLLEKLKKGLNVTGPESHSTTSNDCDRGIDTKPASNKTKKRKITETKVRHFGERVVKAVVEAINVHMNRRALLGLYGTNISGHTIDLLSRIFGTETRQEVD